MVWRQIAKKDAGKDGRHSVDTEVEHWSILIRDQNAIFDRSESAVESKETLKGHEDLLGSCLNKAVCLPVCNGID